MTEDPTPLDDALRLRDRTEELGVQFLLTEIRAGFALLTAADSTRDPDAAGRRDALASAALDVVTERLARTGEQAVAMSQAERDELTRLCEMLRSRLAQSRRE